MAVLPRPPARHVRGPGEAIAIVDLAEDGTSLPPLTRRSKVWARLVAVGVGALAGLGTLIALSTSEPTGVTPSRVAPGRAVAAREAPAVVTGALLVPALTLPSGVTDTDLSAMPDRYVNEPLPPSFRAALTVRGIAGVASVDPPAAIIWTEGGVSYLLTSRARSVPQLVELASQLR